MLEFDGIQLEYSPLVKLNLTKTYEMGALLVSFEAIKVKSKHKSFKME